MDNDIFEQLDNLGATSLPSFTEGSGHRNYSWRPAELYKPQSEAFAADQGPDEITGLDAFDRELLQQIDRNGDISGYPYNTSIARGQPPTGKPYEITRQTSRRHPPRPDFGYSTPLDGGVSLLQSTPLSDAPNVGVSQQALHKANHPVASVSNELPVVQGITLVSTRRLPDRFRSVFTFPLFNAIQSKCFPCVYESNDNFVVSAPTGAGKTAIFELAICRLALHSANETFKVVYQAPTKSLCSERFRDWQAKFAPLDLQVAELTGDTDSSQIRHVQSASIIVTTPEKWDSITRKWKDHRRLMQLVKLFLIDEVHILKDDRGATLEAVVSRMKSVGSSVRFLALSATVPNSQDIAKWLGKDSSTPGVPAPRERFGEEFRPVKLQKHVCGYASNGNDFSFDTLLNKKLVDVIPKWSQGKPIIVFCFTRKSCTVTAKLLANWWATKSERERCWSGPRQRLVVEDRELQDSVASGVAFHHAGLSSQDRSAIEDGFFKGDVNVICCTSTLAVGVNLPCHLVIIKNTVTYQNKGAGGGIKEYSDLEIMQMLGRAGRPQFDSSAVAIIMTRLQKVSHYENMIAGHEVLESRLHENLIDHLNAEIGLGTITDVVSARKWLTSTFLYIRLRENPKHYNIAGNPSDQSLDERLETICNRGIKQLQEHDLVQQSEILSATEFGDAMSRYCIQFGTMKTLLGLPANARVSEILSAVSQAVEFQDIRFRPGEKSAYRDINKNPSIKFPIPTKLDSGAQKVSLIIQAVLGAVSPAFDDHNLRFEYARCKSCIFQRAHRFIRCIIDCQLHLQDSISARNALTLGRSIGAEVWDDSPLHMRQLDGIGLIGVRKLVAADIKSIEELESVDTYRIERAISRHPPFGAEIQSKAKSFPRPRVSFSKIGIPTTKDQQGVVVEIKADLGFQNSRISETFDHKLVYVCLLVDTTDGRLAHFARISAKKLLNGLELRFSATITSSSQALRGFVMCDGIAGTQQAVTLQMEIPSHMFPPESAHENVGANKARHRDATKLDGQLSSDTLPSSIQPRVAQQQSRFVHIDELDLCDSNEEANSHGGGTKRKSVAEKLPGGGRPPKLPNGKWACNHHCRDKTTCKHLCCREGLDREPKSTKPKAPKRIEPGSDDTQTQLKLNIEKTGGAPVAVNRPNAMSSGNSEALGTPRTTGNAQSNVYSGNRLKWVPINARVETPLTRSNDVRLGKRRSPSSDYGLDESQSEVLLGWGDTVDQLEHRPTSPEESYDTISRDDSLLDIRNHVCIDTGLEQMDNGEDLGEHSSAFETKSDEECLFDNQFGGSGDLVTHLAKGSPRGEASQKGFFIPGRSSSTVNGSIHKDLGATPLAQAFSGDRESDVSPPPPKRAKLHNTTSLTTDRFLPPQHALAIPSPSIKRVITPPEIPTSTSGKPAPIDLTNCTPNPSLFHHPSQPVPPVPAAHPQPVTTSESLSAWFTAHFGEEMFHLDF